MIDNKILQAIQAQNAEPLLYVVAGSRGNRINGINSDYDIVGIHMSDVLQHPSKRGSWEVITKQIDDTCSLVSYEAWKFIELLNKGAFAAFEIRDLPAIFTSIDCDFFIRSVRASKSIPSSFPYSCTGNYKSDWPKDKNERKKAVMACFRLCQGISMLAFNHIDHDAPRLIEKINREVMKLPVMEVVFHNYLQEHMRKVRLTDELSSQVDSELKQMSNWIETTAKARQGVGFNKEEMEHMLQALYEDRCYYYESRMDR